MELGQRLKQARLDAGLSQRQLCGEAITRNMLSQIENGSAKPSMDTLRYLAGRLGKPAGYFLEEEMAVPVNQQVIMKLRQAQGAQVLQLLEEYEEPDPVHDPERWLIEALTCLDLAKNAIEEKKDAYALDLLERAKKAGEKTPYYTPELEERRVLLCFRAGMTVGNLPNVDLQLMLLATDALEKGQPEAAGRFLDAVIEPTAQWHFLRGKAWEAMQDYSQAAGHYLQAEDYDPAQIYGCLERCYLAMEDYKQAYFYACKQR